MKNMRLMSDNPVQMIPVLCLASNSPRRRQLLAQIGVQVSVLSLEIDETPELNESPQAYVQRLAVAKAQAGWQQQVTQATAPLLPVLGADTSVILHDKILGKPQSAQEAFAMLSALSGQTHQVMTAVALVNAQQQAVATSISAVTFRELAAAEIEAYIASGEPMDKAGSYAIQGIASIFIAQLQGSYSGVMGLPLFETAKLLQQFNIVVL